MPTFTDLAPELILLTANELPTSSLAALSITSRQLRPLIEPLLYGSIQWRFLQDFKAVSFAQDSDEADDNDRRFMAFVHTILKRPDLASHVARLRLELEADYCRNAYKLEIPVQDQLALSHLIKEMSLPNEEIMLEGLKGGSLDVVTAVLVSRLHNLKILEVEHSLVRFFNLFGDMLSFLGAGPSLSLAHLTKPSLVKVRFYNWNLDEIKNVRLKGTLKPIYSLFEMPSLESISINLPEPIDDWKLKTSLGNSRIVLNNLRTLRLLNSQASVDTLGYILAVTPRLEVLEYNFVQDLDDLWYDRNYECGHHDEWGLLSTVLRKVSSTLECLTVSVSFHYLEDYKEPDVEQDWVGEVWKRRGKMGPLRAFTKLWRLEIPTAVLLGYQRDTNPGQLFASLPPNIEELCLRDDLINMWFEYGYQWSPWESNVRGSELNSSFSETCDPSPILAQLERCLAQCSNTASGNEALSCLNTLILKQSRNRLWPDPFRTQLKLLVNRAGIVGKIQIRQGDAYDQVDIAKVIELDLEDDPDAETARFFDERSKSLSRVYL